MKRIGMLYLGRRGAATVDNLELCKTFAKDNYVYIVISKQIENLVEYYKLLDLYPANIKIFTVNTYNSKISFLFKTLNIFRYIYIASKLKKEKLDFIYQDMITYWGAIVTIFLRKQRIITAIHDPEMHVGEKDFLFETLTKLCVKRCSNIVVFSKKFINIVAEKYSFPKEKICALKLGGYSYYKDNSKVIENNKYNTILFFGRISEYKGLSVLLEAIKNLKESNFDIKLRVVGNGSLSDKEKNLIRELGDSVELINRWIKDDEVESFFKGIDFVVLPYIEATQSGVVMLSYAMQKSVLATDVGALSEQILEDTGLIVKPNDVIALVNGIKKLYENDIFFEKGLRAFYYASQEWTWEKQAQRLINFLNN